MRKILLGLIVLVALVLVVVMVARPISSAETVEANSRPFFVPVILTPSIQPVNGQVLLYKVTNVATGPVNVRLSLYKDNEAVPGTYKDFMHIVGGHTVTYVYEPAKTQLNLGATTVEAPESVRSELTPVPGDNPNAVRSIVANVQLMRAVNGALEPPIVVPTQRCNFEPRGFVPVVTGATYFWNCAPEMFPYDMYWLKPGLGTARTAPRVSE
jgi:hypothetical protein